MGKNDLCRNRKVAKTAVEAPLLVPSFSSAAFPRATDIRFALDDLKPHLTISSLVSAYDIHHGYVGKEISLSDLVFIDSGNYEKRILEGMGLPVEWSRKAHEDTIDSINPLSQVGIVNYDEPGTIADQVKSARSFSETRPNFVSDFLCKPVTSESDYLNLKEVEKSAGSLSEFDIIGVTEKELGSSPVERCTNLLGLRKSLESVGLNTPIHIFGCLEPIGIVLLAMCGGDIFDGLTWARYAFHGDILVYPGSAQLLGQQWSEDDSVVQRSLAVRNLNSLTELMFRLRSYARSHDFDELGLGEETAHLVKSIMERAEAGIQ